MLNKCSFIPNSIRKNQWTKITTCSKMKPLQVFMRRLFYIHVTTLHTSSHSNRESNASMGATDQRKISSTRPPLAQIEWRLNARVITQYWIYTSLASPFVNASFYYHQSQLITLDLPSYKCLIRCKVHKILWLAGEERRISKESSSLLLRDFGQKSQQMGESCRKETKDFWWPLKVCKTQGEFG